MESLSVAVMAHPQRRRWVDKLVAKLDAKPKVCWDTDNDRWETGRRALLSHGDTTHHLVLQDDAVIHRGLVECCHRILAAAPADVPISLYMGRWRHRPHRYAMKHIIDQANGASFAAFGGPWWGVGIILPVDHIEAVVEYGDRNPKRQPNYDLRIAQYYAAQGIDCHYTMPSVVDHQPGQSLTGRKGTRRHAQWYWDGPYSDLDWDGGVVTPADMNLKRFPRTP